jgi:hypothetical protein
MMLDMDVGGPDDGSKPEGEHRARRGLYSAIERFEARDLGPFKLKVDGEYLNSDMGLPVHLNNSRKSEKSYLNHSYTKCNWY